MTAAARLTTYRPAALEPDRDDLAQRWDDVPSPSHPVSADPVRFKTAGVFCGEYVPLSYAVEPLVRAGSLYTLTARTGAGKTAWIIICALAVAMGRSDILGIEVERGRVALMTFENPDDVRMRLLIAAWVFHIDMTELSQWLIVLDRRGTPEEITEELRRHSEQGQFRIAFIDTFAAFFDGDDVNNNVQAGNFMRRMRPMTQLPGLPAVLVAAHPVKNAAEDNLLPYGGGAILNEVDANLSLWRTPGTPVSTLHWQGKIRGLEFDPIPYRVETASSPDVLDAKGRQVVLPYFAQAAVEDAEQRSRNEGDIDAKILRILLAEPRTSQGDLATKIGRSKSSINGKLKTLSRHGMLDESLGIYTVTSKGKKALEAHG